jgi:adenylate cyclase
VPTQLVELIATGQGEGQSLRQQLVEGQVVRIGRAPQTGWAISWDRTISREHVDLVWSGDHLKVTCLANATNPIKFLGEVCREISASAGEPFQIGMTSFVVRVEMKVDISRQTMELPPAPLISMPELGQSPNEYTTDDEGEDVEEHAYKSDELENVAFGDTERQMEVLSNLPQMISGTNTDMELALMLVGMLLQAIPPAVAVAVAVFDEDYVKELRAGRNEEAELPKPALMRVQTRESFGGRFMPSRKLLKKALRENASMMHIVGEMESSKVTMSGSLGWAFCTPVAAESCIGWCLYVSGEGGRDENAFLDEDLLKGDLRFTQLVAQFIGSIRTVRTLQEHTTQLSTFFSPKVIANLTKKSAGNIMEPSERDITVLFCDVRGFSRKSEKLKDNLKKLLESVRAALSAMTGGILAFDGAIADFQGDAALGFWGWPEPLPDGPISACRAALTIQQVFSLPVEADDLLEGFTCGVGIAHGRAIAGQIGTTQQAKIGVFGPVVNQGSRIEGMTRMFGVNICIDETTADFVRRILPRSEGTCRRLAKVRPKGMDTSILVSELLPANDGTETLSMQAVVAYEKALDAIIAGKWDAALSLLTQVPDDDGPKKFLLEQMAHTDNHPPADWDGAFSLKSK